MKPNFALNLSHEGILLLHRSPRGTWTEVGSVKLDDADLRDGLSFLRSTAVGLEGKGFCAKLILPESQILYREIDAPGPSEAARKSQILAALEGVSPYAVADLTFDWINRGERVLVAAVANETLDEAEAFAVEHRFNPISIVGSKTEKADTGSPEKWEPFFGRTRFSDRFLGPDVKVRDTPLPSGTANEGKSLFADAVADTGQPLGHGHGRYAGNIFSKSDVDASPDNLFSSVKAGVRLPFSVRHPDSRATSNIMTLPKAASGAGAAFVQSSPSGDMPRLRALLSGLAAGAGDIFGNSSPNNAADGQAKDPLKRWRALVISAVLILIFLGIAGLLYAGLSSGSKVSGAGRASIQAAGVSRQPLLQPGQILPKAGRKMAALKSAAPARPRIIWPERSAVLGIGEGPASSQSDTAEPVTSLTVRQRADIRAAGLIPPTPEEMAKGRDAQISGTLTPAEITSAYTNTGILQGIKVLPTPPANPRRGDIYVASVDRELQATDATILPNFNGGVADVPPPRRLSPLRPGLSFKLDARGLVKPSKEGTLNPNGVIVRLGKPPVIPPERPKSAPFVMPNPLLATTPKARPKTLKSKGSAAILQARLARAKLRKLRAKARPQSAQAALSSGAGGPSRLAVLTSLQPERRPRNFSKTVAKAQMKLASLGFKPEVIPKRVAGVAGAFWNVGKGLPTNARVAAHATYKNAIRLSRLNLIGVYGSPSKRRALLRLSSGRFVKVKTGDRVEGGRVVAIGVASLSYVKGGRNRVLKIPD